MTHSLPPPRLAQNADMDAIVALVQSAYRGDSGRQGWTTEADILDGQRTDADEVNALLLKPDSLLLVIEDKALVVACCHIEKRPDSAYFGMFAVSPRWQGRGLGRHLLQAAEHHVLNHWQVRNMCMQVIDVRKDLIAWYQRLGYQLTDQYSAFPYGNPRFGIPKRDDLRFVHLIKSLTVSGAN